MQEFEVLWLVHVELKSGQTHDLCCHTEACALSSVSKEASRSKTRPKVARNRERNSISAAPAPIRRQGDPGASAQRYQSRDLRRHEARQVCRDDRDPRRTARRQLRQRRPQGLIEAAARVSNQVYILGQRIPVGRHHCDSVQQRAPAQFDEHVVQHSSYQGSPGAFVEYGRQSALAFRGRFHRHERPAAHVRPCATRRPGAARNLSANARTSPASRSRSARLCISVSVMCTGQSSEPLSAASLLSSTKPSIRSA